MNTPLNMMSLMKNLKIYRFNMVVCSIFMSILLLDGKDRKNYLYIFACVI